MFITLAGLAIDGGVLLGSHRQLQSTVDGAARAGATRLDLARLRASGGAEVQLDTAGATSAARGYVDERLAADRVLESVPRVQVEASLRRVHVVVQGSLRTAFLRIVHVDSVPVAASAFADVEYGIHNGSGN